MSERHRARTLSGRQAVPGLSRAAQNVLRQQSIIDELERKGQDTTYARSILRRLQDMQAVRVAERDRMRASLKSC